MGQWASIQCLRALAALAVVVYHSAIFIQGSLEASALETIGAAGVDLFFIISGLVMWISTSDTRDPRTFLKRRILRIVPLYYFMTAGFILLLLSRSQSPLLSDIMGSLLFIPFTNSITNEVGPILLVGWSLNYEMFFYLIFAMTLLIPRRFRLVAISGILMALIPLRLIAGENVQLHFLSSPMWMEFIAGMMIGWVVERFRLPSPSIGALLLIVGTGILISIQLATPGLPRTLTFGVPCALIVLGSVMMEPWFVQPSSATKALGALGDASYSLYLSHTLFMEMAKGMTSPWPWPLQLIVYFGGSIVVGMTAHRLVEVPLQRLFHQRPAPAAAVAGS